MNDLAAWLGTMVQRGGRGRKKNREGEREMESGMSKVKADTKDGRGLRPRVVVYLAIPFFPFFSFLPCLVSREERSRCRGGRGWSSGKKVMEKGGEQKTDWTGLDSKMMVEDKCDVAYHFEMT
jgi:hypothetical protein